MFNGGICFDGYASVVFLSAKTGDLSQISPLTLKDTIWLNTAISIIDEKSFELEKSKIEIENERNLSAQYLIADIKTLVSHIDACIFTKVTGAMTINKSCYYPDDKLPSAIYAKSKGKDVTKEKPQDLTKEQREARIKAFFEGRQAVNFG